MMNFIPRDNKVFLIVQQDVEDGICKSNKPLKWLFVRDRFRTENSEEPGRDCQFEFGDYHVGCSCVWDREHIRDYAQPWHSNSRENQTEPKKRNFRQFGCRNTVHCVTRSYQWRPAK